MIQLDESDVLTIIVAGATLFGVILTALVSLVGMIASRRGANHAKLINQAVNQIDPEGHTIYALVDKNDREIALMSRMLTAHIAEQSGDSERLNKEIARLAERFEEHDRWEKDIRGGKYSD